MNPSAPRWPGSAPRHASRVRPAGGPLLALNGPHLALAEGALGAMLDPRGPGEADHIHLVQAGLGDVVADGVGLARVGHAAPAALAVWQDAELTLGLRTGQGPAVGLPLLQGNRRTGAGEKGRGGYPGLGGFARGPRGLLGGGAAWHWA